MQVHKCKYNEEFLDNSSYRIKSYYSAMDCSTQGLETKVWKDYYRKISRVMAENWSDKPSSPSMKSKKVLLKPTF